MKPRRPRPRRRTAPQPEVQQGDGRSKARDDALKRIIKQHPLRDEPRVDSVEEIEEEVEEEQNVPGPSQGRPFEER
ncbi:MAG TPA: hypothetical protein VNM24_17415 [Burkholderiales bacterium]|nr:hypothetical protein [Burkholderiales bacterium]